MAKGTQQGGMNAITVGLIVFAAMWLTSTVLLISLYTGQAALKDQANRAREDASKLISGGERSSIPLFAQAQAGGPTVVGLLESARGKTAELATGEAKDDVGGVRGKLDTLLQMIRSDRIVPDDDRFDDVSYHQAMIMLYEAFSGEHQRLKEAHDRVAQLEGEVDRLTKSSSEQKNELDQRAKEWTERLAEIEADRDKYRQDRDQHVTKLEGEFETARSLREADLTKERQRTAELQNRLGKLEDRLAAYREKLGEVLPGPGKLATAREPDGEILSAFPGDDVVYVTLGRKDRLVLGLQFAVYSAEFGIPADGKAKATIRVASIEPTSAGCEIVRVADGQVIIPGDWIANPIYRPDRSVNFVVLGDFDLNHTGVPDPTDAANIEAMITDWGGAVAREITALTDFLVIGAAPRRPKTTTTEQSPDEVGRSQARQQAFDHYMAMVKEANTLSIPVMTQEVFLNFLGYGDRLLARR